MTVATTDELKGEFPSILEQVQQSPVYIRDGDRDVAVLVSLEDFEGIRLQKIERFERIRDEVATELAANLAHEGPSNSFSMPSLKMIKLGPSAVADTNVLVSAYFPHTPSRLFDILSPAQYLERIHPAAPR